MFPFGKAQDESERYGTTQIFTIEKFPGPRGEVLQYPRHIILVVHLNPHALAVLIESFPSQQKQQRTNIHREE